MIALRRLARYALHPTLFLQRVFFMCGRFRRGWQMGEGSV